MLKYLDISLEAAAKFRFASERLVLLGAEYPSIKIPSFQDGMKLGPNLKISSTFTCTFLVILLIYHCKAGKVSFKPA